MNEQKWCRKSVSIWRK